MIKELSKDLIGKTIFGYPTGNNQDRSLNRKGENQKLVEFKVISVGRKYMELLHVSYNRKNKYNLSGTTQQCVNSGYGGNAGYYFFESEEDCSGWLATSERRGEVFDFFNRHKRPTDEQLERIHAILFGGDQHEK
ncbi:hypothetical protein [Vibrio cyclitrophicus]|uniref:hypothetical protein n=1 Tax=Vibrio cyclitrophicus TaxID=47951 RepID=UPI00030B26BD|nr:hypothetical protein [Vibrio cyclitrophicus]OEF47881.1 hypothetical protein OAC_18410 [Vibrio cyclitrophicus 1F273]